MIAWRCYARERGNLLNEFAVMGTGADPAGMLPSHEQHSQQPGQSVLRLAKSTGIALARARRAHASLSTRSDSNAVRPRVLVSVADRFTRNIDQLLFRVEGQNPRLAHYTDFKCSTLIRRDLPLRSRHGAVGLSEHRSRDSRVRRGAHIADVFRVAWRGVSLH